MAKQEQKVQYGTKLEWATKHTGVQSKEFWGAHHFANAEMEYNAQKQIHGDKMYWHQYHAMNNEAEVKGI